MHKGKSNRRAPRLRCTKLNKTPDTRITEEENNTEQQRKAIKSTQEINTTAGTQAQTVHARRN
jgi:hypothetical protein